MNLKVDSQDKERRLDTFLTDKLQFSRSRIQKMIKEGAVLVNGNLVKAGYLLKEEDEIFFEVPDLKEPEILPQDIPLEIVFEDQDLLVVNKPRGMVVHPAIGHYNDTMVNALLYHIKDIEGVGGIRRAGIIHRLDKDTSGLLMVAKNDFSHQRLSAQIKERSVKREYLALVHGRVKDDRGRIETLYGRHPVERKKMAVLKYRERFEFFRGERKTIEPDHKNVREAITFYIVKERFKEYTLLKLKLKTGRTHQIRVHLAHLGYPVVGDQTYGRKKEEVNLLGQFLHAAILGFIHPRSGKYLEFERELPSVLKEILKGLS